MKLTFVMLVLTFFSVEIRAQEASSTVTAPVPAEARSANTGKRLISDKTVTFFDLIATDGSGALKPLKDIRGKVVLAANTASKCGYTPQYKELQALQKTYGEKGFTVLGFPSNDFNQQEPGSDAEIKSFCEINYGVTFPLFQKAPVTGENKQPVFAFLTEKGPKETRGEVKWNFEKFIVNRKGEVVARFPSKVSPQDPKLIAALESALSEAAPADPKSSSNPVKAKKN